ncbi:MAG: QueT transporter family protein [Candidatus Bathyarchaeia archaeon]
MDTRDISLTAISTSLYVVVNIVQMTVAGGYTIYGSVQLRVADCFIALSALFGWPFVIGVTVGCFLTNAYYFLGPVDVIFGPIANLIAASLILLLRKRQLLACVIGALPVGLIVGGYLWIFPFIPIPTVLQFLPAWIAMITLITASSLITIAVIGYALLRVISRQAIIYPLKSRGLKVLENG